MVTKEIPSLVLKEERIRGQAMVSEEADGDGGKSEMPIVAMNPGNAGGVKGCRFEITREGNTALRREE